LVLVVLLVVAAACEGSSSTIEAPAYEPLLTEPSPVPAKESVKVPMAGLIDRWSLAPSHLRDVVQGFVVDVKWADLQEEAGGEIIRPNAIDEAIGLVQELNSADPGLDLGLKLRIRAGVDAPAWAKGLSGEPVAVTDPRSGTTGTVGRFWTDAFGRAYSDLHLELAKVYDAVEELREVTIARCTTVYAEPLIRNLGDPVSTGNLLGAGFSRAADQDCLRQQIDAHDVWVRTRSGLALNPYQALDSDGGSAADVGVTLELMAYCREVLSERCALENNSIRWPPQRGRANDMYLEMYAGMSSLGPPIGFQTAASSRVGDLEKAVEWAVDQGACAVELPRGYERDLDRQQLSVLDVALRSNAGCSS
jgi:hypothetical protein